MFVLICNRVDAKCGQGLGRRVRRDQSVSDLINYQSGELMIIAGRHAYNFLVSSDLKHDETALKHGKPDLMTLRCDTKQ